MAKRSNDLPNSIPLDAGTDTDTTIDNTPMDDESDTPTMIDVPAFDPSTLFGTIQPVEEIPADVGHKDRKTWDWDQFAVGNSIYVPVDEAASARSSAISFAKGTKGRAGKPGREPREFSSQTVEIGPDGNKVKAVRIWRTK